MMPTTVSSCYEYSLIALQVRRHQPSINQNFEVENISCAREVFYAVRSELVASVASGADGRSS